MSKKTVSVFMIILICSLFTSNLFAENQPENIYDSAYVQIEFDELKLLSDGKIIVFLSYVCKKTEELKNSKEYNIVRSALRREFLRVREFASLAENKYQALDLLSDMADDFDLLDI